MGRARARWAGYEIVWLFVLFDLPVTTKTARKRYTQFRGLLLHEGFSQLQFSVYARAFPSQEAADPLRQRIRNRLPPEGRVRLLLVTDRQFGKMENYHGKSATCIERVPEQLLLF